MWGKLKIMGLYLCCGGIYDKLVKSSLENCSVCKYVELIFRQLCFLILCSDLVFLYLFVFSQKSMSAEWNPNYER